MKKWGENLPRWKPIYPHMDDKELPQAKTKSCIYNISTKHDLNLQKCEEAMLCVMLGNFLFFMRTIGLVFPNIWENWLSSVKKNYF